MLREVPDWTTPYDTWYANLQWEMAGYQWKAKPGRLYGPCFYCGRTTWLTVDHKLPRSRGGTDHPDNLVSACGYCNSTKGKKTAEEFMVWREEEARRLRIGALARCGCAWIGDDEEHYADLPHMADYLRTRSLAGAA